MFQMEGIYAPIPIPFDGGFGPIDMEAMKENMETLWNPSRLAGIVVMGSNGEFVFLTEQEKREVIKAVCSLTAPGKRVIAGCGCESTAATIELCKYASEAGAAAALVLNPNYYKGAMKEPVMEVFFNDVADKSPIPIVLYNMPGNSGVNISSALVKKLSAHPNIIGIKDSGGNIVQIMETIRDTPDDFAVFAGSASFLLPVTAAGGKGGTLALANIFPDECVELYELAKAGDMEKAVKLQLALMEANKAVTGRFGIPGLKAAVDLAGGRGGFPRRPLLPLEEEHKMILEGILRKTKNEAAYVITDGKGERL
ncbi:dihydrodipicolinate synthase family protein [Clostridium sp. AM58-1XD]|uniref:dihydrodipicolinate synthase family protein n=1 Tax=Clostridium sp. AM58-1XD TaxID=2292307 RepID=UPI000E4E9F72|nr:dihydrodipicolinate synthase family protein [Clostridium sp. AM58-1XD]RGY98074.1 dihydrodipicolinate synthase family protein [Clostridium sp. AM58-1XD]